MKAPLRLLMAEDSEDDLRLVLRALRLALGDFEYAHVRDFAAMRRELESKPWDVVLSDWAMPGFGATAALALVKELAPDIPFIIVSGTVGEEAAVAAMRGGAHDYILKDRLGRLGTSIERAIAQSEALRVHRRAEEALHLSNERFRRLSESGIVGIVVADVLGHILDANDEALRIFGYSPDELERLHWPAMTPLDRQELAQEMLAELTTLGASRPRETEMFHKDGRRVPVFVGVAMLEYPDCIVFVADLTERKRAEEMLRRSEEKLRQAQRMEAVGRLAGGVAHDFNNLLSVIMGYASLTIENLAPDDPVRADIQEIATAGARAAELTAQLLAFSRQQVLQPRVLDLNDTLRGLAPMLERLLGEDITLHIACAPELGSIKGDPGQVEQIVMNLVVNARDAMPNGGSLSIETSDIVLSVADAEEHPGTTTGPHVRLSLTDTGSGMDSATRARIFEPFFTTKEVGKGTGLGLATVFGIVQQSGGSVWVTSQVGDGTTFAVHFPRTDEIERAVTARPPPSRKQSFDGTILLVEDDDQLRQLTCAILERHGFKVLVAADPYEAVRESDEQTGPIDLLLTDVVMPGMNGRELAVLLESSRPEMRVLFTSGYAGVIALHADVAGGDAAFLPKPFTPQALLDAVAELLEAPP